MELIKKDLKELMKILNKLRLALWKYEYTLCFNQRLADGYNIVHTPRRKLTYGNAQSELLVSLFADNKGLNYNEISTILSEGLLEDLLNIKLLYKTKTKKILSGYRINPLRNQFLLLIPFRNISQPPVYLGADSLTFQRHIRVKKPPKTVLDLATGSGYQLLSLPWQGNTCKMLGIDVNPNAIAIARINALWNQTPWISFQEIDITKELAQLPEKYDLILANPPIIPTPKGLGTRLEGMIHADGGENGLAVIQQLIPQIPSILSADGTAQFILCSLGTGNKPFIIPDIQDMLQTNHLTGRLISVKKIPVELDSYYRGQKDTIEYERWMTFYKKQSAEYWYRLILRIEHQTTPQKSQLDYLELYRVDFNRPPNRERISPQDVNRRIAYFLTDTVMQGASEEAFDNALAQIKNFIKKTHAFEYSIRDFGLKLQQELPEIFPTEGSAIRFWGQVTKEFWYKPKYQERVLW
ncbi:MAG: methyltransferase domain-containing protein [Candidatus Hodarchaeales archaeon]|jgi:2-polyprenyl-3-methyl-5-hydroxy-6-metoxy-1,4-benzoquinol methylase